MENEFIVNAKGVDAEAVEMVNAIINAQIVASKYGFDGIWFALDDLAEGLAKHYNIEL